MHHFLSLLLVIIGLHVSVQTRIPRSVLTVPNGVSWGTWDEIKMCPREKYAIGFILKVYRPSSNAGDDNRVLTGIRLYCTNVFKDSYLDYRQSVQSEVDRSGQWIFNRLDGFCSCVSLLTAFQLRFEDGMATNIKFNCSREQVLEGDGRSRGEWSGWSQKCEGIGICGISTLREGPQGNRNYSVLKNVRMYCCS
ncbi:vitelline membrane outer layer protein 1-like isoform X2 [Cyprinus carpio]|uniref:Vitelline membrane outer layer protein 1-like isoform X2 n=1 Tax=Cyprinus carpio TaxID=7962 RepID=A0A9Q9XLG8_CYPCA|nr:vitelline membrane outer layer protein 1-like isoform X2 [Cyprinus carpio]